MKRKRELKPFQPSRMSEYMHIPSPAELHKWLQQKNCPAKPSQYSES